MKKKRQKTSKSSTTGFPQATVSPSSDKLISGHVIELASKRKQPAWTREVHPPYWTLFIERNSRLDCDCDCNQSFVNGSRPNWHNSTFNFKYRGTYKENVWNACWRFQWKRSALDQNDVFRSVRANENLCFLNQEASSSFQKAKKKKKKHPDGMCVSHSVTLTVLSSFPSPLAKQQRQMHKS